MVVAPGQREGVVSDRLNVAQLLVAARDEMDLAAVPLASSTRTITPHDGVGELVDDRTLGARPSDLQDSSAVGGPDALGTPPGKEADRRFGRALGALRVGHGGHLPEIWTGSTPFGGEMGLH